MLGSKKDPGIPNLFPLKQMLVERGQRNKLRAEESKLEQEKRRQRLLNQKRKMMEKLSEEQEIERMRPDEDQELKHNDKSR